MTTATKGLDSRVAGLLQRAILLEEEHRPLPEDPTPALFVARVSERLAQAASAIEDRERSLVDVSAYLLGAAAFSITAIAHLRQDDRAHATTKFKDLLLQDLNESIDGDLPVHASPDELLRSCLSLLAPALEFLDDDDEVVEALWRLAGRAAVAAERLVSAG